MKASGRLLGRIPSSRSRRAVPGLACLTVILGLHPAKTEAQLRKTPGIDTGVIRVVTRTPVPCPTGVFPLKGGPKRDRVKSGRAFWMETTFTLSNDGRVDGRTRTWSSEACCGFTGSVGVIFMDCSGNILTRTMGNHQFGVNGTVPPGNNSRIENWTDQIPAQDLSKLSQIGRYYIDHWPDPRPWQDRAAVAAKTAIAFVKTVVASGTTRTPGPPGP